MNSTSAEADRNWLLNFMHMTSTLGKQTGRETIRSSCPIIPCVPWFFELTTIEIIRAFKRWYPILRSLIVQLISYAIHLTCSHVLFIYKSFKVRGSLLWNHKCNGPNPVGPQDLKCTYKFHSLPVYVKFHITITKLHVLGPTKLYLH